MKLIPKYKFYVRCPYFVDLQIADVPLNKTQIFEFTVDIPENADRYLDMKRLCEWMQSIDRYACFELEKILSRRD
jgi:hypothetical protein